MKKNQQKPCVKSDRKEGETIEIMKQDCNVKTITMTE